MQCSPGFDVSPTLCSRSVCSMAPTALSLPSSTCLRRRPRTEPEASTTPGGCRPLSITPRPCTRATRSGCGAASTTPRPCTSHLLGTSASPIIVRQYPGERATIDGNYNGNNATLTINGKYTWFWGFEIYNSDPTRFSPGGRDASRRGTGVQPSGDGTRMINLIIHDTNQGVLSGESANDAKIYGKLFYYNGYDAPTAATATASTSRTSPRRPGRSSTTSSSSSSAGAFTPTPRAGIWTIWTSRATSPSTTAGRPAATTPTSSSAGCRWRTAPS